jgi:hypothetical protein
VPKLTRRSLLQQTPVTAAALSLLPAMPALGAVRHSPEAVAPQPSAASSASMVVHVSDVATGEMTLLLGARAIAFHDPRLVGLLIEASQERYGAEHSRIQ